MTAPTIMTIDEFNSFCQKSRGYARSLSRSVNPDSLYAYGYILEIKGRKKALTRQFQHWLLTTENILLVDNEEEKIQEQEKLKNETN